MSRIIFTQLNAFRQGGYIPQESDMEASLVVYNEEWHESISKDEVTMILATSCSYELPAAL